MVMTSAENPVDPAALVDDSIALVAGWLQTATSIETRSERGEVERLHALIDEPAGVHFAMQYIDRVARHADNVLAANELATLARNADLPGFVVPLAELPNLRPLDSDAGWLPSLPYLRRLQVWVYPLVIFQFFIPVLIF